MRFSLQREAFLKPLAQVVNVVERRQTLPVLANLLALVKDGQLSLTGTDLEVEMVARCAVDDAQDGEVTIPARKLFDIVRALPDGSKVTVSQSGDKITVQAGRSRFTLASLPANDFPSIDEVEATERVEVAESALKELIERTAFAMAQQDVRYYLNGLLFDLGDQRLRCVATDGHRLALCEAELDGGSQAKRQIIVPRKGVTELQRLLEGGDRELELGHALARHDDLALAGDRAIQRGLAQRQPMAVGGHAAQARIAQVEQQAVEVIAHVLLGHGERGALDQLLQRRLGHLDPLGRLDLVDGREIIGRQAGQREAAAPGLHRHLVPGLGNRDLAAIGQGADDSGPQAV